MVTFQKASTALWNIAITSTTIEGGGGGGGCSVEGVDEVSGRKWSAIHKEAGVQAECITFAYFDVSWIVHRGARLQVACLGKDAMEVRRGQVNMQASLGQTLHEHVRRSNQAVDQPDHRTHILPCVLALI